MSSIDKHIIQLFLLPEFFSYLSLTFSPVNYGGLTLFTNHNNNIARIDSRIIKRLFDVAFSLAVCIVILPLIPILWLIVKCQSPGPLFFKQQRTGLNGENFMLYKFRSMHVNADADRLQATKDDPRKFPFGEFMRKTNIDELPQFFNVLKGDMSIVGPRPHMLYHISRFTRSSICHSSLVSPLKPVTWAHPVMPGLEKWRTMYFSMSLEYISVWYNENWSFLLDLEIIARTAIQIFFPNKNAY